MERSIWVIIFSLLSVNAWAQIDYSYCSKFIEDTNSDVQRTGFSFPFKVDAKTGTIETINHNMNYNGEKKGEHIYSSTGWAGSIKIVVKEEDSNKISKIEIEKITKTPGAPPKVLTTINFEIKNNKCVPKIGHNSANINGNDVTTTIFDTNLCKELGKYFETNKELNKCFDPKSKENQAIQSLLAKNGYDTSKITQKIAQFTPVLSRYSYSIEQKILTGSSKTFDFMSSNSENENKKMLGILGGSPLISGYMILNDCYEKGLKEVSEDASVWTTPVKNPSEGDTLKTIPN